MRNNKGFTMVELLVVLVIVAILAAVATPLFIQNTKRAKASEAIATMSLIRQALRDYKINSNKYFTITTSDKIQDPLPPVSQVKDNGDLITANKYGLDIDTGVAQYFSNDAFEVDAGGVDDEDKPIAITAPQGTEDIFNNPAPVDFLIKVDGSNSIVCGKGADIDDAKDDINENCAIKAKEVKDYRILMDNSGRIAVSYNEGNTWSNY